MSSRRRYASSRDGYESMTLLDDERHRSRRTYLEPPSPSYYGRNFPKAREQEDYWNAKNHKDVWDPKKKFKSFESRPETYGMANSWHPPFLEDTYSDPYVKRPHPYPARVNAEYQSYHRFSDGYSHLGEEIRDRKNTSVGKHHWPSDDARASLMRGKSVAREARDMANTGAQGRMGFLQKYPQSQENLHKVRTHIGEAATQRSNAGDFRGDDVYLDRKLNQWQRQFDLRRR